MYALKINDLYFIFDIVGYYGFYKTINNIDIKILDYQQVLSYYLETSNDKMYLEKYSDFLFRICKNYLKFHL